MISLTAVRFAGSFAFALTFAVLLVWIRRIPEAKRRYCYPVVGIVGFAAVTTALGALGIGTIAGTTLDVPGMVDDLITYAVLWALAAVLAGESRRMVGLFAVIPAAQVIAFNVAAVVGGLVGLVGLFLVVAGHGVLAYLLFGPVWTHAQQLPDRQRLLHWKARNLLLFMIGMLIVFALLSVASVFDEFVSGALGLYVDALIRIGFAGFLFANVDAIAVDDAGDDSLMGSGASTVDREPSPAGGD